MKRCFEANLAIFKTVNFAQPHRKFCRLLHVSLVLPGCACLMGNLDFKFPSLCLYPTPMNAGKSIKKLVEEFALAWSRQASPLEEKNGTKSIYSDLGPKSFLGRPWKPGSGGWDLCCSSCRSQCSDIFGGRYRWSRGVHLLQKHPS